MYVLMFLDYFDWSWLMPSFISLLGKDAYTAKARQSLSTANTTSNTPSKNTSTTSEVNEEVRDTSSVEVQVGVQDAEETAAEMVEEWMSKWVGWFLNEMIFLRSFIEELFWMEKWGYVNV